VAPEVEAAASHLEGHNVVLFLGRGVLYAVALEGALKLKEITYVAAEGYPAGELKHGPIALIRQGCPVIALVPRQGTLREKMIGNMQEVRARGATVIAVASEDDPDVADHATVVLAYRPSTRRSALSRPWCRFSSSPITWRDTSGPMSTDRGTSRSP
jgi:glucosamine--fructose-6-phosphate aminotransferase (isomerizing)